MRACPVALLAWAACVGDGERAPMETAEVPGSGSLPRTWQAPRMLDDDVYRLGLDGDAGGIVTVVWSRRGGYEAGVWASRYRPALGWGAPVLLQRTDGDVGRIDVEATPGGGAIAMWFAWDGDALGQFARVYDGAAGWGPLERLDGDAPGVHGGSLAVNRHGDAIVTWSIASYPTYDLRARRYRRGAGWDAPVAVTSGPARAISTSVALDDDGVATALWWSDGRILSARAARDDVWSAPLVVATSPEPALVRFAVEINDVVTAVWAEPACVRSASYTDYADWTLPACISSGRPFPNQVRIDDVENGLIAAVWSQSDATGTTAMARFTDGGPWDPLQTLEVGGSEYQAPDLGLDGQGGSVVVWTQRQDDRGHVRARRSDAFRAWSSTETIAEQDGFPQQAQVAVAASGTALAAWTLLQPSGDLRWSLWTAAYE